MAETRDGLLSRIIRLSQSFIWPRPAGDAADDISSQGNPPSSSEQDFAAYRFDDAVEGNYAEDAPRVIRIEADGVQLPGLLLDKPLVDAFRLKLEVWAQGHSERERLHARTEKLSRYRAYADLQSKRLWNIRADLDRRGVSRRSLARTRLRRQLREANKRLERLSQDEQDCRDREEENVRAEMHESHQLCWQLQPVFAEANLVAPYGVGSEPDWDTQEPEFEEAYRTRAEDEEMSEDSAVSEQRIEESESEIATPEPPVQEEARQRYRSSKQRLQEARDNFEDREGKQDREAYDQRRAAGEINTMAVRRNDLDLRAFRVGQEFTRELREAELEFENAKRLCQDVNADIFSDTDLSSIFPAASQDGLTVSGGVHTEEQRRRNASAMIAW